MGKDDGSLSTSAFSAGGSAMQWLGIGAMAASFHPAAEGASGFLLAGGAAVGAIGIGIGIGNFKK